MNGAMDGLRNGKISGYLIDTITREIVPSSELGLTRHGVLGESLTQTDDSGRFAFISLPTGEYNLGVYDKRYAPLYRNLILAEGQTIENLEIAVTPGAFIKGLILDEEGRPPHRSHMTLIREGTRSGRSGFISDSGDHKIAQDGSLSSPPLHAGRYFLRFAGILQRPSASAPSRATPWEMQQRTFDFLYPNAPHINCAHSFDLQTAQALNNLEVRIPRPIWRIVRGRLTGALPEDLTTSYVFFTRLVGMLDDFGSAGAKVNADGTFEGHAQPGRHRLVVCEMASRQPDGRTRGIKQFASVEIIVGDRDLNDVEIQVPPPITI
jgi:hypothetical protein